MQLVTAIVKPHKLDDIQQALKDAGIQGMTVTEVKGFGRQGGHTETYRGAEYKVDLVPKIKIEIIIQASDAQRLIDIVSKAANTGKIGDGKIWSVDVSSLVRIRTGEIGADAL